MFKKLKGLFKKDFDPDRRYKCTLIGTPTDYGSSKTNLLVLHKNPEHDFSYVPTVFENYKFEVHVDGKTVLLSAWDTAGQEELTNIRSLSYNNTEVFLLTFSLVSPDSLKDIERRWVSEIEEYKKKAKYIMVGLDKVLRDGFAEHAAEYRSQGMELVTPEEVKQVKKRIGAIDYIECDCSPDAQWNINAVFEAVARVIIG